MKDKLKIGIIIAVIAGLFVICGAIIGILPNIIEHESEPEIQIIDVYYSNIPSAPGLLEIKDDTTGQEMTFYDDSLACLDFKIKNVGDKTAIIKKVDVEVLNYTILKRKVRYLPYLKVSTKVYIKLDAKNNPETPYLKTKQISLYVSPGEPDRFIIILDSDASAIYDVKIILHYDHKKVETIIKNVRIWKPMTPEELHEYEKMLENMWNP